MLRYNRIPGLSATTRLYTWVDVEDRFLSIQQNGGWPNWLHSVRAYWDSVALAIAPAKEREAKHWLRQHFDPRFDENSSSVLLESLPNRQRRLPIVFEESLDDGSRHRLVPSFSRPSTIESARERVHPAALPENAPPVVVLHSFKGGVGRTQHALALALALCQASERSRVLLVDADLEAPGLTWMLQSRVPNPEISFADFLALVHGDQDPKSDDSMDLIAQRVGELLLDRIFVLPALRLVAWTAVEARVLGRFSTEKVLSLSEAELVANLVPLGGENSGRRPPRKRAQRSGCLQHFPISGDKSRPEPRKRTPFAREQVNLELDVIKTLEENGVILRDGERFHLSEVFRLGLGFKWEAGARPAVLSLSRKARR